jgi:hypothetical protein
LIVVAGLSVAGYLVGRCGLIDFLHHALRAAVPARRRGSRGVIPAPRTTRAIAAVWASCAAAIFVLSLTAHAKLIAEYLTTRRSH